MHIDTDVAPPYPDPHVRNNNTSPHPLDPSASTGACGIGERDSEEDTLCLVFRLNPSADMRLRIIPLRTSSAAV